MNPKKIEQRALLIGVATNIIIGIAGLIVYRVTGIEALFLDAYYTIIALLSGLLAVFISKTSHKKNHIFPNGFFILEPIYAFLKSILSLVLLTLSTVTVTQKAYLYFFEGQQGEVMRVGPVIPYSLLMASIGFGLSFYFRRQNQKVNQTSTILMSESKTSLVDGLVSAGVGLAAFAIWMIDVNSPLGFLKYTGDFFITLLLVFFIIREPFSIIKSSLIEIMGGRVKKGAVKKRIESTVRSHIQQENLIKDCLIYKTGMSFQVQLQLDPEEKITDLELLSEKRNLILEELGQTFEFIQLTYIY